MRVKTSNEFLRAMISRNELTIMELKESGKPYAETAIDVLQRDIDRWRKEIDDRNTAERLKPGGAP